MMVVEIAAGVVYGSMALLADGLHMASHTVALGITLFAYIFARRIAADRRFTFGAGKVNSLAAFASAVLLGGFAFAMVVESGDRLITPVAIRFDQALIVAVVGLVVNGVSAWILAKTPHLGDRHHGHDPAGAGGHHRHDLSLRAAYFHVIADALTSILAIAALLAGKYFGADWLDPVMGFVGAALVARWSYGLLREAGGVLLDRQADGTMTTPLNEAIEGSSNDRIADLHVWSIGHGIYAAEIVITTDAPRSPDHYRSLIPAELNIVHAMIEVHLCPAH